MAQSTFLEETLNFIVWRKNYKKTKPENTLKKYIFTSERLGFRKWHKDDLNEFAAMNADPIVMEHFPKELSMEETENFIQRLQKHYATHGYCYFATEVLATGEFIGFIGLANQSYETSFTPATDIGWRLKQNAWGKGYATEGALRCLSYAFDTLQLERVIATCTQQNEKSAHVMQKIGMVKGGHFKHPLLGDFPEYETCLWYEIKR